MQPAWAVTIGGREHAPVTLDRATIRYGRADWYAQPDAPTLDASLVAEWVTQVPALNEPVTVDAILAPGGQLLPDAVANGESGWTPGGGSTVWYPTGTDAYTPGAVVRGDRSTAGTTVITANEAQQPCTAGDVFTATAMVRSRTPSSTCRLNLVFLNSSGATVGNLAGANITSSGSWQQVTVTATAPADSAVVRVRLVYGTGSQPPGDWSDWDAITLVHGSDPKPYTLSRRFTGRVVAVRYTTGTYDLQAVGNTEQLNRCMTGDQPWPTETEVGRLQRILQLPSPALAWQVWGTSRVSFVARDVDAAKLRSAGELAREYASQAAGLLTELRDGTLVFLTAQRLSRPPQTVTPPPWCVNADELDAALEAGGVVNQAAVAYGLPRDTVQPDGSVTTAQPVELVDDTSSQAAYGLRYWYLGSDLYEATDARNYAAALLANRATPYWQLPVVTTELATLDDGADAAALAGVQPGDLMRVEPLPAGAPAVSFTGLVQGWTEECSPTRWRITWDLARSDTAPLGTVTWEEPGPTYTWQLQSSSWAEANTIDDLVGA